MRFRSVTRYWGNNRVYYNVSFEAGEQPCYFFKSTWNRRYSFFKQNIYIYIFRIFIVIGIKRLIVYFFPEFIHQCLLLCIVSCDRVIWITNIDDWQFFTIHEYLFETVIINEALKITFTLHIYVFFMRDERHDEIEWNRIKLKNLNFETSNIIKYYKQFFVISLFERSIVLYLDLYNPNPNFKLISLFLSESNFLNFIPYTLRIFIKFYRKDTI